MEIIDPKSGLLRPALEILLVIVVVGAGAYYLWGRGNIQPPLQQPATSSTTSIASPAPVDQTAGWKTYTVKTLGLEFRLPPALGQFVQLDEKVTNGETGNMLRVYFKGINLTPSNEPEVIGADSGDFSEGRSALFTDILGYSTSNGKYYIKFASSSSSSPVLIPDVYHPQEVVNPNGVHILRVKNPHPNTYGGDGFIFMPTDLGAIINTDSTIYPGMVFQVNSGVKMNEQTFDQILSTLKFTQPTSSAQTTAITILVPNDIAAYDKAMDECGGCADDPSKTWPFVQKTLTVPYTTDIIRASAEAAAEQEFGQGEPPIIISYFKISGATAYVLTYADIDGWAGVSYYLDRVYPLISKTLLQFPQIHNVVFSRAPGDKLR